MKPEGKPFPTMAEANEFHGLINEAFRVVKESRVGEDEPLGAMVRDLNFSIISKIRKTGDSDLLRSIIKHASYVSVSTIVLMTEVLREGQSTDVYHLLHGDDLKSLDAVRRVTVMARWDREVMTRETSQLLAEYAARNPSDGAMLVTLITDRGLEDYDDIIAVLENMKSSGVSPLAQGVL